MEWDFYTFCLLFGGVAFAGFVDSMAGGGGLITVPIYLSLGLSPQMVLGTNKCVSTIGASMAIFQYAKGKAIYWKTVIYSIATALVGAISGAYCTKFMTADWLKYLLLFAIPVVLVLNFRLNKVRSQGELSRKQVITRSLGLGLVIGFYDGFFGPGTGSFLIFAMVFFLNYGLKEACTNARVVNFTSNIASLIYFLYAGAVYWEIVPVALVAALIGNYFGSRLALTKADAIIKPALTFVLLLLLGTTLYSLK